MRSSAGFLRCWAGNGKLTAELHGTHPALEKSEGWATQSVVVIQGCATRRNQLAERMATQLCHLHAYSNMSPTPIPINNVNHLPRMSKKQANVNAHIEMIFAGSKRQLIVPNRIGMQIDNAKIARLLNG